MPHSREILTRTEQLAGAAACFSHDTLPPNTLEHAKDCLLDHIAVSLYGMRQPWTRFVSDMVASDGGATHSSVYGERLRVPAHAAALVNGTAAHAFELDDWHIGSASHLGAAVIPAVLAVGERERRSGRDVLSAIVTGYEVMARAGMSAPRIIMRGFHPTGTHGPIGAAAGVGNLLRVPVSVMTAALGIGASCGAGLMEFSQVEKGTMVKRVHAGRAAQAGVVAVDLAQRGLTAPKSSLDGKYGYCRVYSDEPDPDALDRALGQDFQIRRNNFKLYACCGMLHASLDAIVDLMAEYRFGAKDVSGVVIGGSQALVDKHACAVPESVMAAQYSMPYSAAAALLGRAMDPRVFDEGTYQDPSILAVARSVQLEVDPAMEQIFPAKFGGSVRVRMNDGQQVGATVTEARGTTGNPFTRDGIVGKARALCEGILEARAIDQLVHLIFRFDRVADASELPRLLDRFVVQTAKPQ